MFTSLRILALREKDKFINRLAELYRRTYSPEEMKAIISFLESPVGTAIRNKQLAAKREKVDLPPEEFKALAAFHATPAGETMRTREPYFGKLLWEETESFLNALMNSRGS